MLFTLLLATLLLPPSVLGEEWGGMQTTPSETECRPYIEKALKELGSTEGQEASDITSEVERQSHTELNELIEQDQRTEYVDTKSIEKDDAEINDFALNEEDIVQLEPHEEKEENSKGKIEITLEELTKNEGEKSGEQIEDISEPTIKEESMHFIPNEEISIASTEEPSSEISIDKAEIKETKMYIESLVYEEEKGSVENIKETEIDKSLSEEDKINEENENTLEEELSKSLEEEDEKSLEDMHIAVHESLEIIHEVREEVNEGTVETVNEEIVDILHEGSNEILEEHIQEEESDILDTTAKIEKNEIQDIFLETYQIDVNESVINEESKESIKNNNEGIINNETDELIKTQKPVENENIFPKENEILKSTEDVLLKGDENLMEPEVVVDQSKESDETEIPQSLKILEEISHEESDSIKIDREEEMKVGVEMEVVQENEKQDKVIKEGQETTHEDATPEEDLTMAMDIPEKLRPRDHISEILRLDLDSAETELLLSKAIDSTLRELKRLYETAIKPLEILYKYRDLSNRHFGDAEIFSKPLILFMGPWSGGKSTIINYLLDNEYKKTALRTGAEPSPAYFNIVMWGEREEVLDGTQLAADWTFSGLQKFGQGLLDRLRGQKLNHPLLEKVNIVEIPGILEIRKQVERLFPFNDACQWFIDRADIIFLVYDPSKLDVGPESEAILDQLKGREYQTRIILNKADQVKPEELMRVQGTLIWNISPLMSSTEPPVMYSTSLWSIPYESGAPTRLLYAQEKAFLRDLRDATEKRVENKISSARRFAVRVRNHAKMVDCYLTTYYNHKTFFGNKKKVSDDIIEHPQNYHIYEGLSTLTNISRYDLPDPEVYKDFFRLHPIYEFQQLSATCTYFRGCPINRLDVAIAYDLPELVGKYKNSAEELLRNLKKNENS